MTDESQPKKPRDPLASGKTKTEQPGEGAAEAIKDRMARAGIHIGTGKLKPGADGIMPIRQTPKGTMLDYFEEKEVRLTFPSAIRTWWTLPYFLAPVLIAIAFLIGLPLGVDPGGWNARGNFEQPSFSLWPLIFFLVIAIGLIGWIFVLTHPRVTLTANAKHIQVGNYLFDPNHVSGMRLGYSEPGAEMTFTQTQIFYSGLRLQYGQWGEDLPYLVNKYHAAEYVVWINDMIAGVGRSATKEHDPNAGIKKQLF